MCLDILLNLVPRLNPFVSHALLPTGGLPYVKTVSETDLKQMIDSVDNINVIKDIAKETEKVQKQAEKDLGKLQEA